MEQNIPTLQSAIELGNPEILSLLTKFNVSINEPVSSYGRRALHLAVLTKNPAIITEILKLGADLNAIDADGATPLQLLFKQSDKSSKQQKQVIKVLEAFFASEVDVNVKTPNGETPLFLAVKHDMKEVADFLMERGADLDTCDNDGNTLAHRLVKDAIELQFLLRLGSASLYPGIASWAATETQTRKESAEERRRKWRNADFLDKLLTKGADANRKNKADELPLRLALQYELLAMIPVLIRHTKDLQILNNSNGSILHTVVKMLDTKKTNRGTIGEVALINSDDEDSLSSFEPTEDYQIATIVKMLRVRGLSAVDVDDNGDTPLLVAAKLQNLQVIEAMLSQPTNVNVSDKVGNTALHYIVEVYSPKTVEVICELVSQKADLYKLNGEGHSPIHVAASSKNQAVLKYFKSIGADFTKRASNEDGALHLAVKKFSGLRIDEDVIDLLIGQGCKLNALNDEGVTPLIVALQHSNLEVLPLLIKKDAQVNFRHGNTGMTPLHVAVQVKFDDRAIRRSSSNDREPAAPTRREIIRKQKRLCQQMRILLRAGAKIDVEDNDGRVPMYYCVKSKHADRMAVLLEFGADFSGVEELSSQVEELLKDPSLLRYLVKLRFAELPTTQFAESLVELSNNPTYALLRAQCVEEVKRMKGTFQTRKPNDTIYAFLHMSHKKRALMATKIRPYLKSDRFAAGFPLYGDLIMGKYYETIERKSLLEKGMQALMKLTEYALPDICVEQIMLGLNNVTLRRMIAAAEQTRKRSMSSVDNGGYKLQRITF